MASQTQNDSNKDYVEIDLMRLMKAVWQKAWAVVLATLFGGIIAFAFVTLAVTPLYESKVLMYVNNSSLDLSTTSFSISSSDISASQSLVDTYAVILSTRTILNQVIEEADLDYDYDELVEMIETSAVDSTEVFQVVVTSPDPKEAALIANTIAEVFPDVIDDIVEGSSAKIVDYAVIPTEKASPSVTTYTLVGALIGFIICVGVIVVLELMDNLIHNEDYLLTNYKNIPVLASIPDMDITTSSKSGYGYGYGGGSHSHNSKSGGSAK
ncbi:MAG: Wzz/FepE/Etk N-terminal domain-containing protein [Oscillospiraceae bacterium]|nr:Wzz/FepE/Etk N-terminal domain-containing protein [Oscillospiraceae bacterium]